MENDDKVIIVTQRLYAKYKIMNVMATDSNDTKEIEYTQSMLNEIEAKLLELTNRDLKEVARYLHEVDIRVDEELAIIRNLDEASKTDTQL